MSRWRELFNFPAGVDIVHIGIQNDPEHHLRMIRAATAFLILLSELFKTQSPQQGVNHVHRIVFLQYPSSILWGKERFGWDWTDEKCIFVIVKNILKDTESFGTTKPQLGRRSQGFVRKRRGLHFGTGSPDVNGNFVLGFRATRPQTTSFAPTSLGVVITHGNVWRPALKRPDQYNTYGTVSCFVANH